MAERQTPRRLYAQNRALTYVAEMQRSASKPCGCPGFLDNIAESIQRN
jgi:hypothetical protein